MKQNKAVDLDLNTGQINPCICTPGSRCRTCNQVYSHGLTHEQLVTMYNEQQQKCAVCKRPIDFSTLVVDHDHACCPSPPGCGQCVRGLLCTTCNVGIGHLGDTAAGVREALKYLERWALRKPITVKVREAYGFGDIIGDFKKGLVKT